MPSQTEIAVHFGVSQQTIGQHLEALETKGAITLEVGTARGIRLLLPPPSARTLPLIGRIAAGAPITAGEHVEELIDVNPDVFRPRADYLFRVAGSSMINAGVLDSDLVAVHEDPDPPTGGIVAAAVPDPKTTELTLTLKRYKRQRGKIVLISENDDQDTYPPQIYGADSGIRIVGRYAGLLRPQHGR